MTKHEFALILLLITGLSCNTAKNKTTETKNGKTTDPEFVFNKEFHNFGTLQAGEIAAFTFKLTNNSRDKLIIKNIKTECGCITVNYPRKGTAAGETAYIEVIFNSAGEVGNVYQEIHVTTDKKKKEFKLAIGARVESGLINIYDGQKPADR